MDIDNDYFLVTFKGHSDFLHVLADGPWTVFGHYLTVEPWTPEFSSSQPFPNNVWTWVRLSGLPPTLYKRSLITAIGESIGPIVNIDYQTDSGRFARLAIKVDLRKPLVSKIIINGIVHLIEYESLPFICFHCGQYGHTQDSCPDMPITNMPQQSTDPNVTNMPHQSTDQNVTNMAQQSVDPNVTIGASKTVVDNSPYGLWMVVVPCPRRAPRKQTKNNVRQHGIALRGNRFNAISESNTNIEDAAEDNNLTRQPGLVKTTPSAPLVTVTGSHVCKPLTLSDFPILSHNSHKAGSSKFVSSQAVSLDASKHYAVVINENIDPNVLQLMRQGSDPSYLQQYLLGEPPYLNSGIGGNSESNVVCNKSLDITRVTDAHNHELGGDHAIAMLE
ncbi:hypothetical protein GQ457_04G014930 [Hibiscus cannabinus]